MDNQHIPRLSPESAVMIFVDNQTGLMASVQSAHPELLRLNMLALRDVAKNLSPSSDSDGE
jgi:ABC-type proline/glycine betaine transport system permease subunit